MRGQRHDQSTKTSSAQTTVAPTSAAPIQVVTQKKFVVGRLRDMGGLGRCRSNAPTTRTTLCSCCTRRHRCNTRTLRHFAGNTERTAHAAATPNSRIRICLWRPFDDAQRARHSTGVRPWPRGPSPSPLVGRGVALASADWRSVGRLRPPARTCMKSSVWSDWL